MHDVSAEQVGAIGRESELAALRAFLRPDAESRAFVLAGRPGIGKTTLWEAGIDVAREQGLRVFLARPSGAETRLAYAALIDLLDDVGAAELDALPPPQRNALEVAILRVDPETPPESSAIAVGFLNALRVLAKREPLLVAVDDIQWLDAPSAEALAFAGRRLEGGAVRFLLARRTGKASPLERALERRGVEQLEVGPLSLGATRRLLFVRLGLALPRRVLRRVFESTLGNPLFVLELGRSLAEHGLPEPGDDIPVPATIEDLLGTHVEALSKPVRKLLLAVALTPDPRVSQLAEIVDPAAVPQGVESGVVVVEGDRLRASHPLLAAVAKERSSAAELRGLHFELAGNTVDEELRAHHLALASDRTDADLALSVARAAATASARGAVQDAASLAEHALRLTPPDSTERVQRLFVLAEQLDLAGEPQRVTDLLTPELESLPVGPLRARAHLLLSSGAISVHESWQHLDQALAGSADDRALRALVLAKLSIVGAATRVERIADAEKWALESLSDASVAGPDVERLALHGLAWARILGGRPIDDLAERFETASDSAFHIADSLNRVVGARLAWRGEIAEARALLMSMIELADERDEPWSSAVLRMNLCDLTMRCGDFPTASRLLDEWSESSDRDLLAGGPFYERCRAMLAVGRGDPDAAEGWAAPAIADAEAGGERWTQLVALRVRGVAALLAHEPARAVESLGFVWEHTQRNGVEDPGAHPVVADLVEGLVELDELDEARTVVGRLRELAARQKHPWGLLTATRCDALIRLAGPAYDEGAAANLTDAASGYEALGLSFDQARTLLNLGRVQRRRKKWGAARGSLEQAVSAFDEMGSTGWAVATRSELARVGARRPRAAGELTEAERRVVDLAVEGLSNKEIAQALVVTVPTVETHLSRVYAKLGVRSRAQLAGRLAAGE